MGVLADVDDGEHDIGIACCFADDLHHLPTDGECEGMPQAFSGSCHSSTGLQRLWPRRLCHSRPAIATRRCSWVPAADKVLLRVDRETSSFLRAQWLRDKLAVDQEASAFLKCRLAPVPERRRMSQAAPRPSAPRPSDVEERPCAADDDSCAPRRGIRNPLPPPAFLA